MLELHHNGLSSCSQKVRLVLAEKGLDYKSHDVDLIGGAQHDPAYTAINPNHVVPTLVDNGHVLIESTLINEYLDDAYPQIPMRSADPVECHAMRMFTKLIDEKVHPATGIVTYAIGARPIALGQPEEVREAAIEAIPDPVRRAGRRSVIEHGVKAPEFAGAIRTMVGLLDRMETFLANSPWLSGAKFGIGDAAALPYALRLYQLAMTPLFEPSVRPRVADWLERLQALPSYDVAVRQLEPAAVVEMFRGFGEQCWPEVEALVRSE